MDVFYLALGVGLSAASGFRVFVPPLVLSVLAQTTGLELPANLDWAGTPLATTVFAAATFLEVLAYYLPLVDNLLDTLAVPAALIAGTLLTYAFGFNLDESARWALAVIAGGGAAGGVQALTTVTRLVSSTTTGGIGNPVVSTVENVAATALSALAVFFPLVAVLLVVALLVVAARRVGRWRRRRELQT